jgi:hypothetical protein
MITKEMRPGEEKNTSRTLRLQGMFPDTRDEAGLPSWKLSPLGVSLGAGLEEVF